MDEQDNAYLGDFGLALISANIDPNDDTISGSIEYLAPEVLQGQPPSPQSDLYSLGIVLYELLTGQYPFTGTPSEVIQAHLYHPLPFIRETLSDLPDEIDDVLQRATTKDPAGRYPDALALVHAFREAVTGKGSGVQPLSDYHWALEALNPYKGLRAFQEGDQADFFGRDRLVSELLDMLHEGNRESRLLAVVGPSGSGKSSVVRAALLPRLRAGALEGSQQWFYAEMIPGNYPFEQLEAALIKVAVSPPISLLEQLKGENGLLRAVKRILPDDESVELLLFIDQFEELFTLVEDETVRTQFLDTLLSALDDVHGRLRVVITLRGDFYDRPLNYLRFGQWLEARQKVVLPMSPEELREAILRPIETIGGVGAIFEPGLVDSILSDIQNEPGVLPLLQYALYQLYEHREGRVLTYAAYNAIGGVTGALAGQADDLYKKLSVAEQETVQQVFLRLVTLGEGTEDTRRRILRTELKDIPQAQAILDGYGKARLLTFDSEPRSHQPTVEVAHEALIRTWGRLRTWLDENRDQLRIAERLRRETAEWEHSHRADSFLATGGRLAQYEDFISTTALILTAEERDFVTDSIAQRERIVADQLAQAQREILLARQARNRLRAVAAVLVIGLVVAVVLTVFATRESQRANRNADDAATQAAIAQDNAETATNAQGQAEDNAATAENERQRADDQAATSDRNAELAADAEATAVYQRDEAQSRSWALQALEALEQGNITLAQALARQAISIENPPLEARKAFYQVAYAPGIMRRYTQNDGIIGAFVQGLDAVFNPNGQHAYVAYGETENALSIMVLDGDTGEFLEHWVHSEGMAVREVALSPDKQQIIVGYGDGSLQLWDVTTQTLVRTIPSEGLAIDAVAFSPTGQLIASITEVSGDVVVREATSGEVIQRFTEHAEGWDVEFAPDGEHIVSVGGGRNTPPEIYLWNIESGEIVQRFEGVHTDSVWEVGITPDGKRLVTVSQDASVVIWDFDLESDTFGQALHVMRGHRVEVGSLAFHPDGNLLATGGIDPNGGAVEIILWNMNTGQEVRRFEDNKSEVWRLAFSPDGENLIVSSSTQSANHEVYALNIETGERQVLDIEAQRDASGQGLIYLNDDMLAAAWDDGVYLWSMSRREVVGYLNEGVGHLPTTLAVSPDGAVLYAGYEDGGVIAIDTETGEALWKAPNAHVTTVRNIAVNGDGSQLLSVSLGDIQVWDADQGQVIAVLGQQDYPVVTALFSPNDDVIASVGIDETGSGEVVIWDAVTYEELRRFPLLDFYQGLTTIGSSGSTNNGVAFTPDGTGLVISGFDGNLASWPSTDIVLFDIETGDELRRFQGHTSTSTALAFNQIGTQLVSVGYDNALIVWDFETGDIVHRIAEHTIGDVSMVAVNPWGTRAISMDGLSSRATQLLFYNLRPGIVDQQLFVGANFGTQPFTQQGEFLFYRRGKGLTEIDAITGNLLNEYALSDGISLQPFNRYVVPQIDHRVVVQFFDSSFLVLDRESGTILSQRAGGIGAFAVTPDGQQVVSVSEEGRLILWDVETGEVIHDLMDTLLLEELEGFPPTAPLRNRLTAYASAAAVSSDGRYLLTGGLANPQFEDAVSLKLWDLETYEVIQRFNDAYDGLQSVALSTDGQWVVAGGSDGRVRMWEIATGAFVREFLGHESTVFTLSISSDNLYVLSGDQDGTVILWDFATGQPLYQYQGKNIFNSVISPDGTRAFVNDLSYAELWRIESVDEALQWLRASRYLREFTCVERERFQIQPLCGSGTPTPTPLPTLTPSVTPTASNTPPPSATPDASAAQIRALIDEARGLFEAESYQEIVDLLTQAIELDPDSPDRFEAYYFRAFAYFRLGEWQRAIDDVTVSLMRFPRNAAALILRSVAYLILGDETAALADLNAAIDIDDTNVTAYNNRAFVFIRTGEYARAIEDLNRGIALDTSGENPSLYALRAIARDLSDDDSGRVSDDFDQFLAARSTIVEIQPALNAGQSQTLSLADGEAIRMQVEANAGSRVIVRATATDRRQFAYPFMLLTGADGRVIAYEFPTLFEAGDVYTAELTYTFDQSGTYSLLVTHPYTLESEQTVEITRVE